MGKKGFAKDPLLYIQQPTIRTPEAPMQSNYITSRETKEGPVESVQPVKKAQPIQKGAGSSIVPAQKKPIKKNAFRQQLSKPVQKQSTGKTNMKVDLNEEMDDYEEKDKEQERGEPTKFIDMTLEEKVSYFSDAPSYAPKMRCEIKTEERSYRGIITDAKDDDVFIQVGKRSRSTKVPMEAIKDIRMLGF